MILLDLITLAANSNLRLRLFIFHHPHFPSFSLAVTGRRMRTVINIYIGNLALADCIISVFCIPFQFQAALLQKWNLPFFMCKLCPFVQVRQKNLTFDSLSWQDDDH